MIKNISVETETTCKVTASCDLDKEESDMILPISEATFREAHARWTNGEMIQAAFPQLDADQREFLMTGITPEKWEAMFGADE